MSPSIQKKCIWEVVDAIIVDKLKTRLVAKLVPKAIFFAIHVQVAMSIVLCVDTL